MRFDVTRHADDHEAARRRLTETFRTRGDVRFPDVLRYLESVTFEPTGVDAYKLSAALRDLHLNQDQSHELLRDAQHWLRFRPATVDYKRQVQEALTEAVRVAEGQGLPPTSSDELVGAREDIERAELDAARDAGERITRQIQEERRLQVRTLFAALAVAWLFIKPPRQPELYMDEAVRDLFPW